jgi:PGF-CTERM protein
MQRLTVAAVLAVVALAPVTAGAATPAPTTGGVAAPGTATGGVAVPSARTGATTDHRQALVTMTVTVRANDGDPIRGATVNVTYEGGSNTTRSLSNGQALLDVPEGVDATVSVDHPEFTRNFPVQVDDVGAGESVDVQMWPTAVGLVQVNDSSGGVPDAQVTLSKVGVDGTVARGQTSSEGLYQTPEIEAGTYSVTVVRPDYRQATTEFDATAGTASTTVTVERGTVTQDVTVVDDHFSPPRPVSDAVVEVVRGSETLKTGTTGSEGGVALSVGVNSQYTFRANKDGYRSTEQTFFVAESGGEREFTITREPSLSIEAVNERVVAGETVLVRVRDAYGDPVEGAALSRNGSQVATTDENGEARVPVPDPGDYRLTASDDGGALSTDPVTVTGIEPATATPEPTPTPTATTAATTADDGGVSLPGFGPLVAVLAVLAALAAARRRRN